MARSSWVLLLLAACTCSEQRVAPPRAAPAGALVRVAPVVSPDPTPPAEPPRLLTVQPIGSVGAVSAGAIALARLGNRTLAFVADADDRAIVTVDVDAAEALASTPIDAQPTAVLVTTDGQVIALGGDDARVHFLGIAAVDAPLVPRRTVQVADEPVSAALVPARSAILVASRWGHAVSVVPLREDSPVTTIDLPRDPAAALASADGRNVLVMHAAGSNASMFDLDTKVARTVSLDRTIQREIRSWEAMMAPVSLDPPDIDIDNESPTQSLPQPQPKHAAPRKVQVASVVLHADQAFAFARLDDGRFVAPLVAVDTGADTRTSGYGASEAAAIPAIVSFDPNEAGPPKGQRVTGSGCLLPRGAAVDAPSARLFVACLGSDQVSVLGLNAGSVKSRRTVRVPKGPLGVAVDDRARRAFVWSAFDRVLSVLEIDPNPKIVARVTVNRTTPVPSADVMRGRALFHVTSDSRISSDGRACASCHPDGRDDGLAWSSPGGRRQTPMLLERIEGTAPYGWDGSAKDFAHHLAHTTARLGGTGLGRRDAEDIRAYLASLHTPIAIRAPDAALVARGDALFHAPDTGCSSCHAGAMTTDGDSHDVGSVRPQDGHRAFDTPSLHLVAHSAPYFHDGRYATLADLLSDPADKMAPAAQLSAEDRAALVVYLEQL